MSYCDPLHNFKGKCNLKTDLDIIPAEYQYFNSPSIGGEDIYLDYCPVVIPNEDGSCRDVFETNVKINKDDYGEKAGDSSRCLEGTYVNQLGEVSTHFHAGCHKVTCQGSIATIQVGREVVYCTPEGGQIEVRGYFGYMICPPSDILCRNLPCVEGCHGRGKCKNGECTCESGYSGDYCQNTSHNIFFSCVLFLFNLL